MNEKEQEYMNGINQDIQLPKVVLEKADEAFTMIQAKKQVQPHRKRTPFKKWMVAGVAATLILSTTIVAVAASGYFNKETIEESDTITYQFELDYELVPGVFKVTPGYLPEGFVEQDEDKYCPEDNWGHGISILPILNTAELDLLNSKLSEENIENIEKTTLNNMEAHIITYKSDYEEKKDIYLFNQTDGYVIQIYGDSNVPVNELKKFADNLTIERIADDSFATEDEKAALANEQNRYDAMNEAYAKALEERSSKGIGQEEIIPIGQEANLDSNVAYTIESAKYIDSINSLSGYDTNNFYDYSEVESWLNEDGSLKPYTRLHMDENGNIIEEEKVNQEFLIVKVKAVKYGGVETEEIALDATLERLTLRDDGRYTWPEGDYTNVPSEDYNLQTDGWCIYMTEAENLEGEKRAHSFFWKNMTIGDELEYTLIFVVDEDMKDCVVLKFNSGAGGSWGFDGDTVSINPSTYFSISQ